MDLHLIDSVPLRALGNHVLILRRMKVQNEDRFGWMPSIESFGTVVQNGEFYTDDRVAIAIQTGNAMLEAHHAEMQLMLRKAVINTRLHELGKARELTLELLALVAEAKGLGIPHTDLELLAGMELPE